MSVVIAKAEELADAISESPELTVLREAAEKLDGDEIANAALSRFQEKQEMVQRAATSGLQLPDEQMQEIKSMQDQIRDIPAVQQFAEAQTSFNELMGQVNNIIAAAVMGPDAEPSGGCQEPGCSCGH